MIKRQLTTFLVVGALTVFIDFVTYRILTWSLWLNIDTSKATGFMAGTLFAYFANKAWTFGQQTHAPGSAWRFVLLYSVTLGANILVNAGGLMTLGDRPFAMHGAFLAATGVSAALNFLGMKLIVFKPPVITEHP